MLVQQTDRQINYIEFAVTDINRAKAFYGEVFGWSFTDFGPQYCEFDDGHMKGGFEISKNITLGGPLVVIYGDNLAELAVAVKRAGGVISKAVFSFPGGHRFHFFDPDGHELAVWCEK
ncbi:MAG: VOC family protein [Alphaproteobacteria bacterium]|nr:VOC family protein [Alphaproteobacteria bacterium]